MGTWVIASLFMTGLLWLEIESNPQVFGQPTFAQQGFIYLPHGRPGGLAQTHSALNFQPQLKLTQVNFPGKIPPYGHINPIDNTDVLYNNLAEDFAKNLEETRPQTFPNQDLNKRNGFEGEDLGSDDHKTSQTTNFLVPHQIETIQSDHFHKQVPAFDVSEYHHTSEKHGEVHYHQHKHVHKHEHKQEHVHQHKQDHQHKHVHSQQHKHDHHSDHKHGHEHKHQHHQEHKHEHKHENHHKHQHGHKHQHHSQNKHQHHHGHKHEHKQHFKH